MLKRLLRIEMRGILYFILADKNRDSVKEYTYMEIELVEVQANEKWY